MLYGSLVLQEKHGMLKSLLQKKRVMCEPCILVAKFIHEV